jgi:hypothetical protein
LAQEIAEGKLALRAEADLLDHARRLLAEYQPILADLISNSDLYTWLAGYDHTATIGRYGEDVFAGRFGPNRE